ncbi:hypothetical protein DFP73DRAFT_599049 [Morchella snyderi]|nr:hypothetical protein DFP73DRAFT_599049 [Morchella snyderi]
MPKSKSKPKKSANSQAHKSAPPSPSSSPGKSRLRPKKADAWVLHVPKAECLQQGYADLPTLNITTIRSIMGFTPTQWETMRDSWEEARRLLLSHEPWPLYHHLAEQEGDKIAMQGILVDISISSLLCDLCRRKSANDKARFNLARANHLAKTKKQQKTASMAAARANAKKNKGKGRADGSADPVPSPARKRTKTAHNPLREEEEYDLEEFLPSEDDEELAQEPPAEEASGSRRRNRTGKKKGKQRRNVEEQAEEEAEEEVVEEEEEIDELYSQIPSKRTWEAYLVYRPIGITHCYPTCYPYEKLPKVRFEKGKEVDRRRRGVWDMPNWTPRNFAGHPFLTYDSLPGPYLSEVVRMVKLSQLDSDVRGTDDDQVHLAIRHLIGALVPDHKFPKVGLSQGYISRPSTLQAIFLLNNKDICPASTFRLSTMRRISTGIRHPPSLYPYFMGDWETLMDNQLRIDRRASGFTEEKEGNSWATGKRKRPEIIELSDDEEENAWEDDKDGEDKEDELAGPSPRQKSRGDKSKAGQSYRSPAKKNAGKNKQREEVQEEEEEEEEDEELDEEEDEEENEEEDEEEDEEEEEDGEEDD